MRSFSLAFKKKDGKLISCQCKATFMKLWMQQCYECLHSNRQNISSRWNSMRRKILLTFPALRGNLRARFLHSQRVNCLLCELMNSTSEMASSYLPRPFQHDFSFGKSKSDKLSSSFFPHDFCSSTTSRFLSASQGSRECKMCPIVMVSYVTSEIRWKLFDWNCGDISWPSIQLFGFNKNPFCNSSWKWRKFVEMEVLGWGLTD